MARKPSIGSAIAALFSRENLLSVWNQRTSAETVAGLTWYATARETAGIIADGNIEKGAGIIAALSPSAKWGDNVIAAQILAQTGGILKPNGAKIQSGDNTDKALLIRGGASPLDVLGGDKVRSFYKNILNPADNVTVTIDRHAYSIIAGKSLTDSELKALKPYYEQASALYREVAAELDILPQQLQAITWETWRRLKGLDKTGKKSNK